MLPLKDAYPGTRAWISVALTGAVLAGAAVRPLIALVCAVIVFVAADGVARRTHPGVAVVTALGGAAAAVAVGLLASDASGSWNPIAPIAVVGATVALGVVHLAVSPRARVLTFSLVPAAGGWYAVPIVAWTVVGGALLVAVTR